jgi:bifunctional enzyme CysN/CysC
MSASTTTPAALDIHAYLDQHQRKELLRFLTCGSVDDGKSTLIGRLLHDTKTIYEDQLTAITKDSARHGTTGAGTVDLALLTDGLKAEREQGITIDVAYRYFSTDRRKFIIADTPGHEQYTRNMATGASTCQLAIILIDARHGVMPQTRRHSFIVSLLGIKHVIVAINKMDIAGYSKQTYDDIVAAYKTFAKSLDIPDMTFIPVSALTGENVVEAAASMPWYTGPTLLQHLETVQISGDQNLKDFRFPVQLVLRPNLDFRGFAGTIASGIVKPGDAVRVLPSGKTSTIKTIETFDGPLDQAFAPQAVVLTLTDEVDISRGDMLVHSAGETPPHVAQELDAMIVWMHEKPLVVGRNYLIKQGTRTIAGEVTAVRYAVDVNTMEQRTQPTLGLNEVGRCRLALNRALVFDAYKNNRATGALILIDKVTNTTVAAGMIEDPNDGSGDQRWDRPADAGLTMRLSHIPLAAREARLHQKAGTILITGLTGSGKSPVAYGLEKALFERGALASVLYGSNMRRGISRDLGFTADERSENLRRSAEVAKIINDAGLICIAAFVAPHDAVRQRVKQLIGGDRFLLVHLSAPPEWCQTHDSTGAWDRAARGETPSFPGLSAPFDAPTNADLVLPTHEISVDEAVQRVMNLLITQHWIDGP